MHAMTHFIYMQEAADVRSSAMRHHALHLERGLQAADRGADGSALAEAGSGGVLQTCRSEARGICGEGAIRGHQGGLGVGVSCKYCGHRMRPGIAMGQTFSGSPDFSGGPVVTISPAGPGVLIDCLKCPQCGYSVSIGEEK